MEEFKYFSNCYEIKVWGYVCYGLVNKDFRLEKFYFLLFLTGF